MRKKTLKVDIIIIVVLVLIVAAIIVALTIPAKSDDETSANVQHEYMNIDEVADKNIGVMLGSVYENIISKNMPNANISFFEKASDMALAVTSGKIDAFACSQVQAEQIVKSEKGLKILSGSPGVLDVAFAFPKTGSGKKLRDEFNGYLSEITADGTLDKFKDKWLKGNGDPVIENRDLTDTNGTLKMATTGTTEPYTYIKNGENVGLDIELAYGFCRKCGYGLEISVMEFSAMIPALASSTYDFAGANITITEERAESVYFSDRYTQNNVAVVVAGSASSTPVMSDYNGKPVGIVTGTNYEDPTLKYFPDSKYLYFNNNSDVGEALKERKIDSFLCDVPILKVMHNEQPDISFLPDLVTNDQYAFGFQKNSEKADTLREQFNEMLAGLNADGSLEKMTDKWLGTDESAKVLDTTGYSGENGTINVIINTTELPFVYLKDNKTVGLAMELVDMFCRKYGYAPNYEDADFNSRITGLVSGKYDIAASAMTITDERKESINFSDPFYDGGIALAVRTADIDLEAAQDTKAPDFFQSVADSFEKNFIREDRWMLILTGIGTTSVITVMSALFGTVLAFLVCMFRRTGSKLANIISDLYVKLLQGTPIVVLLMILYYIIFGESGLDAVWVAIIGFSLNFGAYGSEIMRSGIESIDAGQREAALALGYSENQAFFRFIFPQATVRFLPVYRQEIVSLLKSTAIVGYIAIEDLTKMSDIIRSRTYEAFFPLIATAIIYFILAWIISLILKFIMNRVDYRRRKRGAAK